MLLSDKPGLHATATHDQLGLSRAREHGSTVTKYKINDCFAPSYRTHSPGAVAELAEVSKCQKYQHLPQTHCFTPVAFESLGAVGSRTLAFLKDIGRRIRLETGEPKATFYLLQRLSVAVQRGNCALINGCIG